MSAKFDTDRRRFLRTAGMTIAAGRFGVMGAVMQQVGCLAQAAEPTMPSLGGTTGWLNSPPLTTKALRGKVVLVQFCTYTCINWLRTLPYIRAWTRKYTPEGLVVLGVHSPEFEFEKNAANVRRALGELRIDYPIALDANHAVWNAFRNRYWPALYFVDVRGRVRHQHFGEGAEEQSERYIQGLLTEAGTTDFGSDLGIVAGSGVELGADWANLRSPELYLGYERAERFASAGGLVPDAQRVYAMPAGLRLNQFALSGDWSVKKQAATLDSSGGRIACSYHARDLHLVMGVAGGGTPVRFLVRIDGQPPGTAHGADVDERGEGVVAEPRLYQLVRQSARIADRRFDIEFLDAGVEAFAFTFG